MASALPPLMALPLKINNLFFGFPKVLNNVHKFRYQQQQQHQQQFYIYTFNNKTFTANKRKNDY